MSAFAKVLVRLFGRKKEYYLSIMVRAVLRRQKNMHEKLLELRVMLIPECIPRVGF